MARKEIIYQGLSELPILIEDTSINSPNYFRVNKLPTVLTAGTNFIQFKGNASLFAENAEILIEVIDSNGNTVYYETDVNVDNGEPTAVISIYVNQDTAPGTAYIVLVSTAKKDINGIPLNVSNPNVRWIGQTYIDIQKANDAEIIFDQLPDVNVFNQTSSYVDYSYNLGTSKISSVSITGLQYYYYNNTAILTTGSNSSNTFDSTALNATVRISYADLSNAVPAASNIDTSYTYTSSVDLITKGALALTTPLSFNILNSNSKYVPKSAIVSASITYEQSASLGVATENTHNLAVVYFGNLQPLTGTISKIRSYYKSSGIGEYIFVNETDISDQASEYGFTANSISASFFMPTVHRNDRLDFKFEFINPYGVVSKQYVESLNNLFLGGNTYIGGNDNLLTGSLFVAGATGTGVEITGKGNASLVKSIGYQGLVKAQAGTAAAGFVLYSGSIQSVIGSTETYSGVGLDLVANTSSYFRYTTANGGLLDIRTDTFFIGNNNVFLSGSNNNLEILVKDPIPPLTKFHLRPSGEVTASAFIAFTGSSNTNNYLMLDTKLGLIDGKNIGRQIYSQTTPYTQGSLYIDASPGSGVPFTNQLTTTNVGTALRTSTLTWYSIYTPDPFVTYLPLPYENRISVYGNVFVQRNSGGASVTNWPFCLFLRFGLSNIITGSNSFTDFGSLSSTIVTGASGSVVSGSGFSPMYTALHNGSNYSSTFYTLVSSQGQDTPSMMTPFKIDLSIPTDYANRLVGLRFDWAPVILNRSGAFSSPYYADIKIANLYINAGRQLYQANTTGTGGDFVGGGYA